MNKPSTNEKLNSVRMEVEGLTAIAVDSIRSTLRNAPLFLVAVAVASTLAMSDAHAWAGEYENAGRTVGQEIGRAAVDKGYGPASKVAGILGGLAGGVIGRPADAKVEQAKKEDVGIVAAQERARRDAAYDAERKRIDPNYTPMVGASTEANSAYSAVGENMSNMKSRTDEIIRQYRARNGMRE